MHFKWLSLSLAVLASVVHAVPLESESSPALNDSETTDPTFTEITDPNSNVTTVINPATNDSVVMYDLPNGRHQVDMYTNGAFSGSLIEGEDGMRLIDENGDAMDLETHEGLQKRIQWWRLVPIIASLIKRFGARALRYFECVAAESASRLIYCSYAYSICAGTATPPWGCTLATRCIPVAAARRCLTV